MSDSRPVDSLDGAARVSVGDLVSSKFRVERVIGEGGMGVVVAATHLQLDEPVALKFLRAQAIGDPETLARFMREARAAAKLKSEHVARVLDVAVTDDGTPYIVMEYLEGRDLAQMLRVTGSLDVASATEYIIQACEGLAEAHARGIVHRDIKPDNLFLVDRAQGWQFIKILDFGISKFAGARAPDANFSTQSIMGSPCYMSPEQLRSTATVDQRTDIWSLGATLFELLSGRTPYDASRTLPELIAAILERPTPRLDEALQGAPQALVQVVAKCMSKDRDDRFANAAELAVALLPFAPKRARSPAERAAALARGAGASSRALEAVVQGLPSDPPPPGSGAGPPLTPPTLRVRSGSALLTPRKVESEPPVSNTDTLGAKSLTASSIKQSRRGAPWIWAVAGVVVACLGIVMAFARGTRTGSSSAAGGGTHMTAASPQPAVATVTAVVPPLPSASSESSAGAAPADATPSALPSSAPASSSITLRHHPALTRPQSSAQSLPTKAQPGAEGDLDIRMQR
jgi:serine/threonine-protein kinase